MLLWRLRLPYNVATGKTALHIAAHRGYRGIADWLIAGGANMNVHDQSGFTPLHTALRRRHTDVTEFLMARGANVDARDGNGQTPLHIAASIGRRDLAELLISYGANVNAKDSVGWTHLRRYHRVYGGFAAYGNKYIICHLHLRDFSEMPLVNGFPMIADGWWTVVTVIFDLTNSTVVAVNCNGA